MKDYFWYSVNLALTWLQGITDGYNKITGKHYKVEDFYFLNSIPDYETLQDKFYPEAYQKKKTFQRPTHCTGIVYPTPDCQDIYFSQATWTNW